MYDTIKVDDIFIKIDVHLELLNINCKKLITTTFISTLAIHCIHVSTMYQRLCHIVIINGPLPIQLCPSRSSWNPGMQLHE